MVQQNGRSEPIEINGVFVHRASRQRAGHFQRRIEFRGSQKIAVHSDIIVSAVYRRRGIAKAHYTRCFEVYSRWGIDRIEIFAMDCGPFVWPAFGFSFVDPDEKARAWDLFCDAYEELSGHQSKFEGADKEAYRLWTFEYRGIPIGSLALKKAAERGATGTLRYKLELNNEPTLRYLKKAGYLSDAV